MTLGWEIPKWENRTMGWAKVNQIAPNTTQKMPKGSQKGTNGSQKEPKGSPKGATRNQKWAQGRPKCIKKSSFGKGEEKGAWTPPVHLFSGPFWEPFSIKNDIKNQCKSPCRKNMDIYEKLLPKSCQNEVHNQWQIYDFSEPAISCFREEYNVKIVFSHDQGYQKSFKNQ